MTVVEVVAWVVDVLDGAALVGVGLVAVGWDGAAGLYMSAATAAITTTITATAIQTVLEAIASEKKLYLIFLV